VLFQAGRVAMVRGDLPLAWERLQEARAVIESESAPDAWLREVVEVLAEVELWSGRPAAAYELVREGLQLVDGTDELSFAGTLLALGCRALADQGESRRDPASRRELARLARPLVEVAGRLDASHRGDAAAAAWRESELARLARTATAEDWRGAAEAWEAVARPFLAGYCRWRETEARLDLRVDAEAISLLRRTHAAARESGAAMLQRELEKLAGWHRIDLVAPAQDADPGVLDAYALTPREVEVLVGLAQGRTNREIAERLFISVKTASVHVSNILRKLDVTGRQEAARVAHRLGVDASGPH
jgi:DNA-binding CsgD family transcriptional regulator